jgi:hypothetical protein
MTMNTNIATHIQSLAVAAATQGRQVFIIGSRQQWHGSVSYVDETCIVLSDAVAAYQTGDLSPSEKNIDQWQDVPLGIIIVPMSAVDAVIAGKARPKK